MSLSQRIEDMSPEEKRGIMARSSPAGLAVVASKGKWVMAPHLKLLNQKFMAFTKAIEMGQSPRMVITMPPRHGKSEYISKHCPPWVIGTHPEWPVILVSHTFDFVRKWGREARQVLERCGKYFDVEVSKDNSAAHDWGIEGRAGHLYCAGIGGPVTGLGGKVIILDDTVKDHKAANSEVQREDAWEWFRATLLTRCEPGAGIIAMHTRWHEEDLIGKILGQTKETGEEWEVVNIPALARENDPIGRKPGEALWPDRFNERDLARIKASQGTYWFGALYQGSPLPDEGGRFKRSWIRYFKRDGDLYTLYGMPAPNVHHVAVKHCRNFVTVDLAFTEKKENDYFACAAWAATPQQDLLMLDMHRERLEGPDIFPAITRMYKKYNAQYAGIEATQAQLLVIQLLRKQGYTIRALQADTDKLSRAIPATIRMEAGQIYIPEHDYWVADFVDELLAFNKGAHDDQVDCLSYAAVEVQRFGAAAEPEEYGNIREQAEKVLAEEMWNRIADPRLWSDFEDGD
jgi:predicted phage terminase large subunit-like protein